MHRKNEQLYVVHELLLNHNTMNGTPHGPVGIIDIKSRPQVHFSPVGPLSSFASPMQLPGFSPPSHTASCWPGGQTSSNIYDLFLFFKKVNI